jgi:hypothetical protein
LKFREFLLRRMKALVGRQHQRPFAEMLAADATL